MDLKSELVRQLHSLNLEVPSGAAERLIWLLDELLRWNRRVNLTAVNNPAEGVEKHLTDSLTLLPLIAPGVRLKDIGSGGGFPCLPLKIVLPELRVCSAEASRKKVSFQRHVARTLGLRHFEAIHVRVGPNGDSPVNGPFDVVVSRAFAGLVEFAHLALPYLRPGGKLIAMKGPEGDNEVEKCFSLLAKRGVGTPEIKHLRLPASEAARTLIILKRID